MASQQLAAKRDGGHSYDYGELISTHFLGSRGSQTDDACSVCDDVDDHFSIKFRKAKKMAAAPHKTLAALHTRTDAPFLWG